jgi:hypothetical protein
MLGWSGTEAAITETNYWPIVTASKATTGLNDWQGKQKY